MESDEDHELTAVATKWQGARVERRGLSAGESIEEPGGGSDQPSQRLKPSETVGAEQTQVAHFLKAAWQHVRE